MHGPTGRLLEPPVVLVLDVRPLVEEDRARTADREQRVPGAQLPLATTALTPVNPAVVSPPSRDGGTPGRPHAIET
ncbi:hypothetical protein ACFQV2_39630 [Actinokineospora soli]|uniref:Uncharacterized protein n=1 Tax=Actinokineospora soli TaxID=1048753 RepID=A0ABW2U0H7_9PSEU